MSSQIYINEVFPNPETGVEWVELIFIPLVGQSSPPSLLGFSLSDSNQIIYSFDGQEIWENNFLVVELSKLNNDEDSVILKDESQNIIDQMSYSSSSKGKSWSRSNIENSDFLLTDPSPLAANLIVDPTATPTMTPTISPSSTPTPTSKANPTPSLSPTPTNSQKTQEINTNLINKNKKANLAELFPNYTDLQSIKLTISDQSYKQRHTRLAIISQNPQKSAIINAIMGSSLLILAAGLLFYDRQRKQKK